MKVDGLTVYHVKSHLQEDANTLVRRQDLKIRDRQLRVSHAKAVDSVPKKSPKPTLSKSFPRNKFASATPSKTTGTSSLSYQGTRSNNSGGPPKKTTMRTTPSRGIKRKDVGSVSDETVKKKRPAVAARKAK